MKIKLGLLIMIVGFILAGCNKEEALVNQEPQYQEDPSVKIAKDEVVLFAAGADAKLDTGDLYLVKNGANKEKISSEVIRDQFIYLYNTKVALFLDKDNNLMMKEKDKEEVQLSTDVYPDSVTFSKSESAILYLKTTVSKNFESETGDLYLSVIGGEKEKIASDVKRNAYQISVDGTTVTYLTKDGSLYRKESKAADKEKIGSDVVYFLTSPDGKTTVFDNSEGNFYIKKAAAVDKERMDADKIGEALYSRDSQLFVYLDEYREETSKGELVVLKDGYAKSKIGSDVTDYKLTDMGYELYFLNEDKGLYVKNLKDPVEPKTKEKKAEASAAPTLKTLNPEEHRKLDDDIVSFDVAPDGSSIIFTDTDGNLFLKRTGEQKSKIGSGVKESRLYNKIVVFLDEEKNLYSIDLSPAATESASASPEPKKKDEPSDAPAADVPATPVKEKKKLAEQVESYAIDSSLQYLTYKTKSGELFLIMNGKAPVKLVEKSDEYNTIHFLGRKIHEKLIGIGQMTGSWKGEDEESTWYLEITKDKKFKYYDDNGEGQEVPFTLENATPHQVDVVFTPDSDDMFIWQYENKDTFLHRGVGEAAETGDTKYVRVTPEEVKKVMKQRQADAEKKRKMQAKIDQATALGDNVKYTYLYDYAGATVYHDPSTSNQAGTLGSYNELYVKDTYVDENGVLWCQSNVYFSDIGQSYDVWFKY
ncbi:hypothetical protein SD71_00225 [Cohnella kolymensis]|uniref:DUF5050 domain-containing protein n=1 Tax=Cohnella kolymensis TaxID=1590652 RepID=A0ABR5A8A9_9BACL|nr:hypothetical protein [Cohnella kolymensis]KIL37205.1 hypothetical protein SD71_00225 [Cohnella kolymensis]